MLTIMGNTIINNKLISSYSHADLIQFNQQGVTSGDRPLILIANNFMMCSPNASMSAGINGEFYSNIILIYNNIISQHGYGRTGIVSYATYPYPVSLRIFNNTIINGSGQCMSIANCDTLIAKNNIFINDTSTSNANIRFPDNYTNINYIDIDYNQYYNAYSSNTIVNPNPSTSLSLSSWQALGNDIHSSYGMPIFANKWGSHILDYQITSGFSGGINLSQYFTTDIRGAKRVSWEKGALESQ